MGPEPVALHLHELARNLDPRSPRRHDANVVALMLVSRVSMLVTKNGDDFIGFIGFGGIRTPSMDDV